MEPESSNHDNAMTDLAGIAPAFSFVVDKDFVASASDYRPQEFGNAVLVMTGTSFSLRFERDRGLVFVDAGNDAVGWHKLEYVLEFVDSSVTQQQFGDPPGLAIMANLLQLNWDGVVNLFSDQQEISQLQAFAKQKSAGLLSKLFNCPVHPSNKRR